MLYLLTTIGIFLSTAIGHIVFHRFMTLLGKKSFKTVGIFVVGFFINLLVLGKIYAYTFTLDLTQSVWLYPIPLSGAFLYVMLFFAYIIYSASPYLGQEGPTSKILKLLHERRNLTERQMVNLFTDKETILDRIDDLKHVSWIKKKGQKIVLTDKGGSLTRILLWYRRTLRIKHGG